MDNMQDILLGSEKNINSVNVNSYGRIELTNNVSEINEFTVNDIVNSSAVFDAEREENQVYRIYGRIEWMSLLNGLKADYSQLEDFFNPSYDSGSKNLIDSFDFYLVAPASGATYFAITNSNHYMRSFDVIAGKEDFEIYNAGFSNNVYGEQTYAFSFKSDFDVGNLYDKLGFPLTELFLYAQYKPSTSPAEQMSYTTWSTSTGAPSKVTLIEKDQTVGGNVETQNGTNIYDIIGYIPEEYFQTQAETQKFYIRTQYDGSELEWSYNPFIPFRLRYLDGVVSTAKLSEIVENSTSLSIYPTANTTHVLNAQKSTKQTLSTNLTKIIKWDTQSTPYYAWNPTSGILRFTVAGTYNISFKTQIYLPYGSDKYIAQVYLEKYDDYEDEDTIIPNSIRKFYTTNTVEGINVTESFNEDDELTVRLRLIPNPDERKIEIIPDYALMLTSQGKYVWRDILPQGYVDPITNLGVDYPFFNQRRYLFDAIVFDTPPNLSTESYDEHPNTQEVFDEIEYYNRATTIDLTPNSEDDLNNIGKPCQ